MIRFWDFYKTFCKPLVLMGRRFFICRKDEKEMPTINMVEPGKKIEEMRKLVGMTVKELQEVFGFATPQAIYKWQHGTAMPTIDNLVILAAVFGCRIDDIIVVDRIEIRKTA